jgi:hypothetical protein
LPIQKFKQQAINMTIPVIQIREKRTITAVLQKRGLSAILKFCAIIVHLFLVVFNSFALAAPLFIASSLFF